MTEKTQLLVNKVKECIDSDMSNIEISEKLGISNKWVTEIVYRYAKRSAEQVKKMRIFSCERARKKSIEFDFSGENNPNWRGGLSKDNYRYKKIQIERYPERVKARESVQRAVKSGRLKKKPCFCGEDKVFAHHEDYSQPLDVVWLCRRHHREKHNNQH